MNPLVPNLQVSPTISYFFSCSYLLTIIRHLNRMQPLAGRKCASSGLEQQKEKWGKRSATKRRTLWKNWERCGWLIVTYQLKFYQYARVFLVSNRQIKGNQTVITRDKPTDAPLIKRSTMFYATIKSVDDFTKMSRFCHIGGLQY